MKECKKKIKKIYQLLFSDEKFENFAINDIVTRGIDTIEQIRADEELELDFLSLQNMKSYVKPIEGKQISSPMALAFQAGILTKLGKIDFNREDNALVKIFEIILALSILFGMDRKSKASEVLL